MSKKNHENRFMKMILACTTHLRDSMKTSLCDLHFSFSKTWQRTKLKLLHENEITYIFFPSEKEFMTWPKTWPTKGINPFKTMVSSGYDIIFRWHPIWNQAETKHIDVRRTYLVKNSRRRLTHNPNCLYNFYQTSSNKHSK